MNDIMMLRFMEQAGSRPDESFRMATAAGDWSKISSAPPPEPALQSDAAPPVPAIGLPASCRLAGLGESELSDCQRGRLTSPAAARAPAAADTGQHDCPILANTTVTSEV